MHDNFFQDVVSHVERQVGSQEEYHKALTECHDWLASAKNHFQHLADFSGDKKTLQDRLSQLRVRETHLLLSCQLFPFCFLTFSLPVYLSSL